MAQRNPTPTERSAAEAARLEVERLASETGTKPITDFSLLRANFWPEDESVDDFIRTVREHRHESERRRID